MITCQLSHKNNKITFVEGFNHIPACFGTLTTPSPGEHGTLGNRNAVQVKIV
jgi:hypothetical protein